MASVEWNTMEESTYLCGAVDLWADWEDTLFVFRVMLYAKSSIGPYCNAVISRVGWTRCALCWVGRLTVSALSQMLAFRQTREASNTVLESPTGIKLTFNVTVVCYEIGDSLLLPDQLIHLNTTCWQTRYDIVQSHYVVYTSVPLWRPYLCCYCIIFDWNNFWFWCLWQRVVTITKGLRKKLDFMWVWPR